MAKITMAATTEVKVSENTYIEVEVEVEGEAGDESADVAIKLAGALSALETAQFGASAGEPAPDTGGPSAPMT